MCNYIGSCSSFYLSIYQAAWKKNYEDVKKGIQNQANVQSYYSFSCSPDIHALMTPNENRCEVIHLYINLPKTSLFLSFL